MNPAKSPTPSSPHPSVHPDLRNPALLLQQLSDPAGSDESDEDAALGECPRGIAGFRNDPFFCSVRETALALLKSPTPDFPSLRLFVRQALQIRRSEFALWKSLNRPRKRKGQQPDPMPLWASCVLDDDIADALFLRADQASVRLAARYTPAAAKEFRVLASLVLLVRVILAKEAAATGQPEFAADPVEEVPEEDSVIAGESTLAEASILPPVTPTPQPPVVDPARPASHPQKAAA